MIVEATEKTLLPFLSQSGDLACRFASLYETYGTDKPFARFFIGENSAVSLLDGDAIVLGGNEEIACFLAMQSDVKSIACTEKFAALLNDEAGFSKERYAVLKGEREMTGNAEIFDGSLKELYAFLSAQFDRFPPFEPWYLDVSYRLRHGHCHIAVCRENGTVVSCAMTTALSKNAAVIGSVATHSAYRNKGYASQTVKTLAEQLQKQGKTVYISPKHPQAQKIYESIGFVPCGEWVSAERM